MDHNCTWADLAGPMTELKNAVTATPPQGAEALAACDRLLPTARALAEAGARQVLEQAPELAERIRFRLEEPPLVEELDGTVVLFDGFGMADVRSAWLRQIRDHALALDAMVRDDRPGWKEWMMGWVEGRSERLPFFRAEHFRDSLREVRRLAELLTHARTPRYWRVGATLLADGPGDGLRHWRSFGPGRLAREAQGLRLTGAGNTLWLEQDFGAACIAFDFTPLQLAGPGAGMLFAFAAAPCPGQSWQSSAGPMEQYNYGLDTYHVSLCRGASGMTHLRRTRRGLRMLSSARPDPCKETGRTYRVEIWHAARTSMVRVDGRPIHYYRDGGVFGPPREQGRFGVRHFSAETADAIYGNLAVRTLE